MFRKILKIVGGITLLYVIYAVASTYIYSLHQMNQSNLAAQTTEVKSLEELSQTAVMNESVAINSKIEDSLALRGELIDQAETSLSLAQYKISNDESGLYLVKKLEDAAKRGVDIQILINGLSNSKNSLSYLSLLDEYDNVEIKVIGGLNLFKPWEMNNVLHDKLILVDDIYLLSSGRSISNRFLLPTVSGSVTEDIDVVVKREGPQRNNSLIKQSRDYYDELWAMDYAKNKKNYKDSKILERNKTRLEAINEETKKHYQYLLEEPRLENMAFFPVNNGYLAFNETNKIVKMPIVWKQVSSLINEANEEVDLMSPYVVVSNKMFPYIDLEAERELNVYTNSGANSPNLLSFGGYIKQKNKLLDRAYVWEFQSKDFIHQKAMTIDEEILGIGSFNVDPRSTFLSSESMLFINSPMAAKELNEAMIEHKEKSLEAANRFEYKEDDKQIKLHLSKPKKMVLSTISFFSPWFRIFL